MFCRRLYVVAPIVVAALVAPPAARAQRASGADSTVDAVTRAQLDSARAALFRAYTANDSAGMVAAFTEDASIQPPGVPAPLPQPGAAIANFAMWRQGGAGALTPVAKPPRLRRLPSGEVEEENDVLVGGDVGHYAMRWRRAGDGRWRVAMLAPAAQ